MFDRLEEAELKKAAESLPIEVVYITAFRAAELLVVAIFIKTASGLNPTPVMERLSVALPV